MTGIYARQSIYKRDSLSIEDQIERCREYAPDGYIVYQDAGKSGKNTARPAFRQMMEDARAGKLERIVCYKIDRISRSVSDFVQMWDELSSLHIEFVSVKEQFDTSTPIGRTMLYIITAFAQLERETTSQRVTDNYYRRAKDGAWPGGQPPFGYDISRVQAAGRYQSVLVPNADVKYVIALFHRYATGAVSLGMLAKQMFDEFEQAGRAGERVWTNISIKRILNNPIYAAADADLFVYYQSLGVQIENALAEFDGSRSAMLVGSRDADSRKRRSLAEQRLVLSSASGIVSSAVFLQVQRNLARNRQIKNKTASKYSWLSGLLRCGACGYSLKVQHDPKSNRNYFYCSNHYGGARTCDVRHSERPEDVETYVMQQIADRVIALSEGEVPALSPEQTRERNELKLRLIDVQDKQRNLVEAITSGGAAAVRLLAPEIDRLDAETTRISKRLDQLTASIPDWLPHSFFEMQNLTFDGKRDVARRAISRVSVLNNSIEITWR